MLRLLTREAGKTIRRYSDELEGSSASTEQPNIDAYQEEPASTISSYAKSSKKYHDSGGYGRARDGKSSQKIESYGSASASASRRATSGYDDHSGPRETMQSGRATIDSVSDNMNMLNIRDFEQDAQYTASPTSAVNATTRQPQSSGPSLSYSSQPVIHESRAAPTASWPSMSGSTPSGNTGAPQSGRVGTPGAKEKLDSRYQIRNYDYKKFFRPGRVFSTLWTDPTSEKTNRNQTFISEVMYGEKVHTKIRRFVVVRQRDKCCNCLPVTSYEGRSHKKSGIELNEHGQIYSHKRPKEVQGMKKKPLKVILSKTGDALEDTSLINYGRIYTVESNVKVLDVGVLDDESQKRLQRYYRDVNFQLEDDADDPPIDSKPQRKEADLAGMGAGFSGASQDYQSADQKGSIALTPGYQQSPQSMHNPQSFSQNRAQGYNPLVSSQAPNASSGFSSGFSSNQTSTMSSPTYQGPVSPDPRYSASYNYQNQYSGSANPSPYGSTNSMRNNPPSSNYTARTQPPSTQYSSSQYPSQYSNNSLYYCECGQALYLDQQDYICQCGRQWVFANSYYCGCGRDIRSDQAQYTCECGCRWKYPGNGWYGMIAGIKGDRPAPPKQPLDPVSGDPDSFQSSSLPYSAENPPSSPPSSSSATWRGSQDPRSPDSSSGRWTSSPSGQPGVPSSQIPSSPISSSGNPRRGQITVEDDDDDEDIILPTREQVEASRSSKSRRYAVLNHQRIHGSRQDVRRSGGGNLSSAGIISALPPHFRPAQHSCDTHENGPETLGGTACRAQNLPRGFWHQNLKWCAVVCYARFDFRLFNCWSWKGFTPLPPIIRLLSIAIAHVSGSLAPAPHRYFARAVFQPNLGGKKVIRKMSASDLNDANLDLPWTEHYFQNLPNFADPSLQGGGLQPDGWSGDINERDPMHSLPLYWSNMNEQMSPAEAVAISAMETNPRATLVSQFNQTEPALSNSLSDVFKHMGKHTRPYACQEPQCNGRDFGDKGGLTRHEKERHGTEKFCCTVRRCPRSTRGFGRKRNLDLHFLSRHAAAVASVAARTERTMSGVVGMNSDSMEPVGHEAASEMGMGEVSEGGLVAPGDMERLRVALRELEARKIELAESQAKVDADIEALKRTMQLVMK
ncbi:hypothetical protein G7Y89_g7987 [Cudoniella acicularis]|uniref:C2H2-type domain-containing protein n=1 Tax=Cudoniella acicularis TaxID=354080 RepID=A0A8H4RJY2_9HELO|nr:hypothetical protein G7Y89_g7987 [Cudoniella acicularis]